MMRTVSDGLTVPEIDLPGPITGSYPSCPPRTWAISFNRFAGVCVRVRAVYPPEPNRALVGFDTRLHPVGHETIIRAKESKEPAFSPPVPLLDGPRGFILAIPIFRNNRFEGQVVGTFRGADLLSNLL